ncbi:MAG: integration host factor, actinobacterial type [Thermoleophilaceae bacterium]
MPVAHESPAKTQPGGDSRNDGRGAQPGIAPERSLTQRMEALKRANEIRTRRARLKRDLKGGRIQIHTLLLDPPDYLATAKAFDLLLAVPKYGRVKVNRILTQCRISPSKTIGGLSERQRNELVSYLRR